MSESANIDRVSMIVLRAMRVPLFILICVYSVGIGVFGLIPGIDGEPMSFFHALYFLSYTATTTGFGELPHAFSNAQRLWAIVLLHVSVVAWLYSIGALIRLFQNPHFRRSILRYRFARRVSGLDEPFVIICGFGDAGSLLARGLDNLSMAAVIIDSDEDRIKALALRNVSVKMLGVCADSSDPQLLLDAGLQYPQCKGIVAVTDDEYANMKTTVMTRVLNPDIAPICRVDTQAIAGDIESLGSVLVLDSFEVFADRLCVALRRPAVHALGDWLVRMPGATLDHRMDCPAGRWIICGYGRMGHRLEENLRDEGIQIVVIDPEIPEEDVNDRFIRGTASTRTLEQAGVREASCVIICTASDTINLRVMMNVRELNPEVFLVMRQNHYRNEVVLKNAPVDLVMHPDRVISRRIQLELVSPGLHPLLDHLEDCPIDVLLDLMNRLRKALRNELPVLWTVHLDAESAPALQGRTSQEKTIEPVLRDLLRDPHAREQPQDCVPLLLDRGEKRHQIPNPDMSLLLGDRILFCGTRKARNTLDSVLGNPYTLEYLVSGIEPPRSYLVRYLKAWHEHVKSDAT